MKKNQINKFAIAGWGRWLVKMGKGSNKNAQENLNPAMKILKQNLSYHNLQSVKILASIDKFS